jgi:hypothetical protein
VALGKWRKRIGFTGVTRYYVWLGWPQMGFRYRKSFRLARGTRLNLTGRGISSVSIGRRGSTINFGQKGVRGTVGVPGSGLSYSSRLTSGVLPALVIAILAGILVAAASGHRLAKVAIVVILIPCVMFMLTHHATEQTEALSIKTIAQDRPQIEAIRSRFGRREVPLPRRLCLPRQRGHPSRLSQMPAAQ